MKKLNLILSVFLIAFAASCSQKMAPEAVIKAFQLKFPSATKVSWGKENEHEYEAEFDLNGAEASANFSDKGEWLETESEIEYASLPQAVQNAFSSFYPDRKAKEETKIEKANGDVQYEIEYMKGLKTAEAIFTSAGVELKQ